MNSTKEAKTVGKTGTPMIVDKKREQIGETTVTTPKLNKGNHNATQVKSPSDTTLYAPALRKAKIDSDIMINKISDFVEAIRMEGDREKGREVSTGGEVSRAANVHEV